MHRLPAVLPGELRASVRLRREDVAEHVHVPGSRLLQRCHRQDRRPQQVSVVRERRRQSSTAVAAYDRADWPSTGTAREEQHSAALPGEDTDGDDSGGRRRRQISFQRIVFTCREGISTESLFPLTSYILVNKTAPTDIFFLIESCRSGEDELTVTVKASNFGPHGNFGPLFNSEGLAIIETRLTKKE